MHNLKNLFNLPVGIADHVEADDKLFSRASYVNQARVHQGYHYPRVLVQGAHRQSVFSASHRISKMLLMLDLRKYTLYQRAVHIHLLNNI